MHRWSSVRRWLAVVAAAAAVALIVVLNLPPRLPRTASPLRAHPAGSPTPHKPAAPAPTAPAAPAKPTVDAAAFRGLGDLAFVSHGLLYVLDGATGKLTQITHEGTASYPAWSHDGQWLAYVRNTGGAGGASRLWLVRNDGTDRHAVGGSAGRVAGGSQYAWSPTADVLAVAPQPQPKRLANGLWLVPASGPAHLLAFGADGIYSFLWSPDGASVAADVFDPVHKSDTLATVPAASGPPTPRFLAPHFTGLILASWSPHGRRIAFWEDPQHSGSIAADGLQLFVLPLTGGRPQPLPATLPYRSWLSWSPDGRTLAMVEGRNRMTWDGKGVALCDTTGRNGCLTALRAPGTQETYAPVFDNPGMVTLDPAWSPDGQTLALVRAASRGGTGGWGGCPRPGCTPAQQRAVARQELAAWLRTRTLWLVGAHGGVGRKLPSAGTGIYDPQWSRHGGHLLYIRSQAVWEVPTAGGPARRIAGPINGANAPYGYYGHIRWSAGWAWYRERPGR